jgi:hypothetical protein
VKACTLDTCKGTTALESDVACASCHTAIVPSESLGIGDVGGTVRAPENSIFVGRWLPGVSSAAP